MITQITLMEPAKSILIFIDLRLNLQDQRNHQNLFNQRSMQDIEPFYNWRHLYVAEEDSRSPFYGRTYSEFEFSQTIYNYYIHPQWDEFGSRTLYMKLLFADYEQSYAIIELLVDALRPLTGEKLQLTSNEAGKTTREVYKEGLATNIACFASISRHEVTYEGKKVIGSAQRRFGNAVLQHGSILLDKEHLRLPEFLKIGDDQKAMMRSLLERESATLSEICGRKLTAQDVADVITERL